MKNFEVNFDGIAGPTHHFGGLSYGNLASMKNKYLTSNPKKAALQCLKKMKFLCDLGLIQGIIPPHERPHIPTLKRLGFKGSDQNIVEEAYKNAPLLFFNCSSSSAMWAANCATITPSTDGSGSVNITAANLQSEFHRSIECEFTTLILKKIFSDPSHFIHHHPLPSTKIFSDEGAANHTRFCKEYGQKGIHLFVYGRSELIKHDLSPIKFPARQSLEASQAIARQHGLDLSHVIFAQQNPKAIDAGVFHNDVVSVGNCNLFFYHEDAFVNTEDIIKDLTNKIELNLIKVTSNDVTLQEAVNTYLFNSQIVCKDTSMILIAPQECKENKRVSDYLKQLIQQDTLISKIFYLDLRESMQNGGGPACLRIRVVLNEKELAAINQNILLNDSLYLKLVSWVETYYRDTLSLQDLYDPNLLIESQNALDALTKILQLGSIYSFQKPF